MRSGLLSTAKLTPMRGSDQWFAVEVRPPATSDEQRQMSLFLFGRAEPDGLGAPAQGFLGVWDDRRLTAACLWRREQDQSAFIWRPIISPQCRNGPVLTTRALLKAAVADARVKGCRYAVSLAASDDDTASESLSRAGFSRLTETIFLTREIGGRSDSSPAELAGVAVKYDRQSRKRFHAVFEQVRSDSQDCVGLKGLRSAEQAFAVFAGAGKSMSGDWLLWERERRDVALLLMNEHGDGRALEISYLGVVPAARRRGVARGLAREALCRARARNLGAVVTAVDAMNTAARGVYDGLGFVETSRHHVFLQRFPGLGIGGEIVQSDDVR